jgi:exopolyphosphatase / guanosine-5'-triphosphate,3'-diphosphate pyrophosphatase
MIRASIDIGTNSVLLLVAELSGEHIHVLDEKQQIPRLGQGVDQTGNLSEEARDRVISVLKSYREFLIENYRDCADHTTVTATSAVRDANNRSQFLDRIFQETGWQVTLLSGKKEAQVTYRGALSVLEGELHQKRCTVLDIGGGSTEIATGTGKKLEKWDSLDMGSVRFTERFLKNNPPAELQVDSAGKAVRALLDDWASSSNQTIEHLVGVAGTVTSMAGIDLQLDDYDTSKINGHILSIEFIYRMADRLKRMTPVEIEKRYPVFLKGRGEVITAGLIILSEFMNYCKCEEITVSTGGIRHGILLEKNNSA